MGATAGASALGCRPARRRRGTCAGARRQAGVLRQQLAGLRLFARCALHLGLGLSLRLRLAMRVAAQGALQAEGRAAIKEILENPADYPLVEEQENNIFIINQKSGQLNFTAGSGLASVRRRQAYSCHGMTGLPSAPMGGFSMPRTILR